MAIKTSSPIKVSNEVFDEQLDQIPTEVKFCTRCVVSNQRPKITFDENGICSACNHAHDKWHNINWVQREEELRDLLDQHRNLDGSYDIVVPGSGGKDSVIVSHKLKHEYNMHPLTVTWAPFMYTDIGFKNFISWVDSGFDNINMFPNGIIHRKLALLSLDLLGDAWDPFAYGQQSWAFQISAKFGIPLIMFGENGDAEYGGTTRNADKVSDPVEEWSDLYYRGKSVPWLVVKGLDRGIFKSNEIFDHDFSMYDPPHPDIVKSIGSEMHWWSYYHQFLPQEHYYYSVDNTGFEANPQRSEGTYSKYASLDDKTDGFHFYLAYMKFGIARCTSDAAHEIRDQHITRDEAVALVRRYDGEFPRKYYKEFLDYLGITDEQFWFICNKFRSARPHLWEKDGENWVLKHTVWGEERVIRPDGEVIK